MAVNDKYLDPRLKIEQMIYDIRGMLLDIEHTLGNIPHEAEALEDYSVVFTESTEGDYIHPETPTHPCPEGFGEDAYWDCIYQCWMMPNDIEEDEYNLSTNIDTDACYDAVANEWMRCEEDDWSNDWTAYMAPIHEMEEEMQHSSEPMTTASAEALGSTTGEQQ
jgi:hypothetical protein|tara:strand:- start:3887 stop:4378 length:492 start_codon:yes stop_codon:yes gene_type:complete